MNWIKKLGIVTAVAIVSGVFIYATIQTSVQPHVVNSYGLPKTIDFAGESVPLSIADVSERLDREMIINTNLHSTTTLILKRANRVFPIIEPILKKNYLKSFRVILNLIF